MKRITLTDELFSELKSALEDSAIYYPANTYDDDTEKAKWQIKHDALVAAVEKAKVVTEERKPVKPLVVTLCRHCDRTQAECEATAEVPGGDSLTRDSLGFMFAHRYEASETKRFACPECKETEFKYDENVGSSRSMGTNNGKTLEFYDERYFDGDSDPGVVCANWACRTEIDDSDIEVEFN